MNLRIVHVVVFLGICHVVSYNDTKKLPITATVTDLHPGYRDVMPYAEWTFMPNLTIKNSLAYTRLIFKSGIRIASRQSWITTCRTFNILTYVQLIHRVSQYTTRIQFDLFGDLIYVHWFYTGYIPRSIIHRGKWPLKLSKKKPASLSGRLSREQ